MCFNMRSLLKKYGVTPKKKWSQYFLVSEPVIKTAASYAQGVVLEIGAGLGTLTKALAARADKVYAIEKDQRFVKILSTECVFDNVEIIHGDIRTINLPSCDRVISNVPYHLSSYLMFTLLDHPFELGVLFFQKEFAQKLVEKPGSPQVSRLSIMAQTKADISILQYVDRRSFYPVPHTDCALVKIVPHQDRVPDPWFETVVKGLFSHKKKTVKNALLSSTDIFSIDRDTVISAAIPHAEKRVFSLSIEEMQEVTVWLQAEGFLCSGTNTQ